MKFNLWRTPSGRSSGSFKQEPKSVSLVIGGGSGYGEAIAAHLARRGDKVVIASRNKEKCDLTSRELSKAGSSNVVIPKTVDIESDASISNLALEMAAEFGVVDKLFCTSAISQSNIPSLLKADLNSLRQIWETNAIAQLNVLKHFFALFNESKQGLACFFTSTAGWDASSSHGAYNVSKCLLNSIFCNVASELSELEAGMKVALIDPWEARTEMNEGSSVSPEHLIPLIDCIIRNRSTIPQGLICTPDGWTKPFPGSKCGELNLFVEFDQEENPSNAYNRVSYEMP